MVPRESMASYLASIELLAKQLRDAGETVSDKCITTQVLRSLPDKYRSLRQLFKMLETTRKTMASLTEMLLQENAEFTARDETKTAFKTKVRMRQTHTFKSNSAGSTSGDKAGKPKCWTCEQEDHMKLPQTKTTTTEGGKHISGQRR